MSKNKKKIEQIFFHLLSLLSFRYVAFLSYYSQLLLHTSAHFSRPSFTLFLFLEHHFTQFCFRFTSRSSRIRVMKLQKRRDSEHIKGCRAECVHILTKTGGYEVADDHTDVGNQKNNGGDQVHEVVGLEGDAGHRNDVGEVAYVLQHLGGRIV